MNKAEMKKYFKTVNQEMLLSMFITAATAMGKDDTPLSVAREISRAVTASLQLISDVEPGDSIEASKPFACKLSIIFTPLLEFRKENDPDSSIIQVARKLGNQISGKIRDMALEDDIENVWCDCCHEE